MVSPLDKVSSGRPGYTGWSAFEGGSLLLSVSYRIVSYVHRSRAAGHYPSIAKAELQNFGRFASPAAGSQRRGRTDQIFPGAAVVGGRGGLQAANDHCTEVPVAPILQGFPLSIGYS